MVVGCQPYAPANFTPRKYSWFSFLSHHEGHIAIGRIICQWNIYWNHLGSNQGTFDLWHSTLTTVPPRPPNTVVSLSGIFLAGSSLPNDMLCFDIFYCIWVSTRWQRKVDLLEIGKRQGKRRINTRSNKKARKHEIWKKILSETNINRRVGNICRLIRK